METYPKGCLAGSIPVASRRASGCLEATGIGDNMIAHTKYRADFAALQNRPSLLSVAGMQE